MDIKCLQSVIAIIDKGSIAAAARAQLITPSAVSQRILALEKELNCKLFSRAGRKVKPTQACLNIEQRARHLIAQSQLFFADIDDSGLSGTLKIGANSTALTGIIPRVLSYFKDIAPTAKLQVTPGTSIGLHQALLAEEIDMCIIVKPATQTSKSLRYWVLRREPLILIHHNSIRGSVEQILATQPYIQYDPLCWGGQLAKQYLQDNNINKQSIFDLDSLEAITQLVSESVGVSLIPDWIGLNAKQLNISTTLIDNPKYQRELILMTAYHPKLPKLVDIFLKHAQSTALPSICR